MKENKKYKKIFLIYTTTLVIIMCLFLLHVGDSLIKFEKNQPEKVIEATLKDLKKASLKKEIHKYISDLENIKKGKYEREDIELEESLSHKLDLEKLKISQNIESEEGKTTYSVLFLENPFLEITLEETNKQTRLGLLSFSEWKIDKIVSKIENGFFDIQITTPNNYKVYVNEKEVEIMDSVDSEQNEILKEMTNFIEVPTLVTYKLENFWEEPKIEIKNARGEQINYTLQDKQIIIGPKIEKINRFEEAKVKIENVPDIMKIAKDWSLFLTKDLKGAKNGYETIQNYLIEKSILQKYAYNWATGIDITFTSNHTLENPPFINEFVNNFEIINEQAFSCEVYLEKKMKIAGKKHTDVLHDRMYFIKKEGDWKLFQMEAITEGKKENNGGNSNHYSGI